MKKKLVAILFVFVLMLSMMIPVFAAERSSICPGHNYVDCSTLIITGRAPDGMPNDHVTIGYYEQICTLCCARTTRSGTGREPHTPDNPCGLCGLYRVM